MPAFLSDEWFAALADALRGVARGIDPPLVIQQTVTGGAGDVTYALRVDADGVSVHRGGASDPDVQLRQDRVTAAALARGTLAARTALAEGRLHVQGDPARLVQAVEVLAALADATADLRATTSYADD